MSAFLLVGILLVSDTPNPVEPLTHDQIARVQQLVQQTQARDRQLKQQLERRQNELAGAYSEFQLDVGRVEQLQDEVVSIQRQLLGNYHQMQIELRSIVGEQRFALLRKRIDRVLQAKDKNKASADKRSTEVSAADGR